MLFRRLFNFPSTELLSKLRSRQIFKDQNHNQSKDHSHFLTKLTKALSKRSKLISLFTEDQTLTKNLKSTSTSRSRHTLKRYKTTLPLLLSLPPPPFPLLNNSITNSVTKLYIYNPLLKRFRVI